MESAHVRRRIPLQIAAAELCAGHASTSRNTQKSGVSPSTPTPSRPLLMAGNIRRCGSYLRIREAIKQAAQSI